MILDNAFVAHRPGIKTKSTNFRPEWSNLDEQKRAIETEYKQETMLVYGHRPGCCVSVVPCLK